jgi:hypothetical protein
VKKPRRHTPYCSPAVQNLIDKAEESDRLTVMLKYHPGIRPTEVAAAYRRDVPGLEVSSDYPPLLHVTGDKLRLHQALGHPLTVGAVADFQDYLHHLRPTSRQRHDDYSR